MDAWIFGAIVGIGVTIIYEIDRLRDDVRSLDSRAELEVLREIADKLKWIDKTLEEIKEIADDIRQ